MLWIYKKPNEYVVFCFVFYIKKSLSKILLISIYLLYHSGLVKVILKLFGSQTSICKSFFIMDPNLMSHQFSAQPTRKDKTNTKFITRNPLKNKCL